MKKNCSIWLKLWCLLWARRRASDPKVQSPDSSQQRLSHNGDCMWNDTFVGTYLTYFGVIMEAMSSVCVSHPFVIGCHNVSAPVTWGLVLVNWAKPSTVLVLFNEQWSNSKFMCQADVSSYSYVTVWYTPI
ncbi:hypothetical protein TIFTF001_002759 [Ficus carica]|uniref:Uncharacterized protein n=1 Tax=Ficus carica TaxID=3494 RepID=A0AA88CQ15_FICCA|nr:hypothetical protein TIFTF001_002759 [Ficus carica]